jgi:hypothetical protein
MIAKRRRKRAKSLQARKFMLAIARLKRAGKKKRKRKF